ncbi:MAG: DUF4124 domain-containing protein [Betaproteobacteria bacterium]|nr:DUF4124 domain-containing protein [Betaproteobacteria bacterium]
MRFSVLALSLLLGLASHAAQAAVYKWIDDDGRTVYSNSPPPPRAKKVQVVMADEKALNPTPEQLAAAEAQKKRDLEQRIANLEWQLAQAKANPPRPVPVQGYYTTAPASSGYNPYPPDFYPSYPYYPAFAIIPTRIVPTRFVGTHPHRRSFH